MTPTTGESKVFESFYKYEGILAELIRVIERFERNHGCRPKEGVIHARHATEFNVMLRKSCQQVYPLECGGFQWQGIHWHWLANLETYVPYTEYAVVGEIPIIKMEGL